MHMATVSLRFAALPTHASVPAPTVAPRSKQGQRVDVALAAYGRTLSNRLPAMDRDALAALAPKLVDTHGTTELAKRRAMYLVDQSIRFTLPAFLRGLPVDPQLDDAAALAGLPEIVDLATATQALELAHSMANRGCAAWEGAADTYAADSAYAAAAAARAATQDEACLVASAAAGAAAHAARAAAVTGAKSYAASRAIATYAAAYARLQKATVARSVAALAAALAMTEAA